MTALTVQCTYTKCWCAIRLDLELHTENERLRARVAELETTINTSEIVNRLRDRIADLEMLITEHNEGCNSSCDARGVDYCEPYVTRGKRCPDCQKDWNIGSDK
jgi:hypothetical protein